MVVQVKVYSIRSRNNKRVCFIGSTIEKTLEEVLQGKIDYHRIHKNAGIIAYGDCYIDLLQEFPYSGKENRSKVVYEIKDNIKKNLSLFLDVIN